MKSVEILSSSHISYYFEQILPTCMSSIIKIR